MTMLEIEDDVDSIMKAVYRVLIFTPNHSPPPFLMSFLREITAPQPADDSLDGQRVKYSLSEFSKHCAYLSIAVIYYTLFCNLSYSFVLC